MTGMNTGHAKAAAELDVISTRKAELGMIVVSPPRRVEVRAAEAVGVVDRHAFESRDIAGDTQAYSVHQVAPDHARTVGEAVGEQLGFGIEQDARRFAGACG